MTHSQETARVCTKCGRTIPAGQRDCRCASRPHYWLHSRETILLLCIVGLGAAFAVTGITAQLYHDQRRALAQEWHRHGAAELASGKPQVALADFRVALIYGRDNVSDNEQESHQLDLAEALEAAGRLDESQSYLLDLWQRAPGNGRVNLDLARLAARDGDDDAARRYYEGAINGVWEGNSDRVDKDRFDTRLELYRYLLASGDSSSAQAALLATAASLPPDASLDAQVGQLMLDAGHSQQALAQFEAALRIDRRYVAAQVGAGLASFNLGDDVAAVRYLEQALREKQEKTLTVAETQQANQSLEVAQATLAIDPSRVGLDAADRARRTVRSLGTVAARLEACAATRNIPLPKVLPKASAKIRADSTQPNDLPGLYAGLIRMRLAASESDLVRDPRRIGPTMDLVFAAEAAVTEQCGPPEEPTDIALVRIARRQQGARL